jgi:hypothetical protein
MKHGSNTDQATSNFARKTLPAKSAGAAIEVDNILSFLGLASFKWVSKASLGRLNYEFLFSVRMASPR